ncbi:uncharacterized protein DNG_05785 [Cephalotrichum gorgonifer]|uniref:Cell cycle control protein n=1 Tax=Cephalotrichum gorgonifer TaxID=2041049 RepID=A0AAE8SVV1_9PEZI|nr:uncharacterized protein DNG_05785 [Cephalotrichum gorgonifer]
MDDELFEVEVSVIESRPRAPAAQVFVDLTDEPDSPPSNSRRPAPQARRTPARRDGSFPPGAGDADPVIDLTGDDPSSPAEPRRAPPRSSVSDLDDIIILRSHTHTHFHTHSHSHTTANAGGYHGPDATRRELSARLAAADARRARSHHRETAAARHRRLLNSFQPTLNAYLPPLDMRAIFPDFLPQPPPNNARAGADGGIGAARRGANLDVHLDFHQLAGFGQDAHLHHHHHHHHNEPPAASRNKMEIAPPREGFTRDTGEDTVVVCPACGDELEYDPGKGEGKRRKRDKGDHHFWVVKACGHVYCQNCFEARRPTTRNQSKFPALDGSAVAAPQAKVRCAVEDCKSEVTVKGAWVGIFL